MDSKVSVCMAVYNGAAFVKPQIDSILVQIGVRDELIVVDDASEDCSQSILQSITDPRLHVYRNPRNVGVLATFEKALMLATGEIVFLSDQDDIWLPGKVEKVLNVFTSIPGVTMVATDAMVVDGQGRTISESFFSMRGCFSAGAFHNFVKNKYLGCTLSFRRIMLRNFLPIPRDVPMHDMWFGILNDIYGRTYFINEPLIAYRRHGRNASPPVHADSLRMALWRCRLAKNIAFRVLGHSFGTGPQQDAV